MYRVMEENQTRIETNTTKIYIYVCIGKGREDYLKCESDIRKSIKTFPFTLLYPFVVFKQSVS